MINADLAGQLEDFLVPIRNSLVVDNLIRSERSNALDLLITARSCNDPSAVQLRKLQGKDGNAPRAQD
jgi:hypothetical protein